MEKKFVYLKIVQSCWTNGVLTCKEILCGGNTLHVSISYNMRGHDRTCIFTSRVEPLRDKKWDLPWYHISGFEDATLVPPSARAPSRSHLSEHHYFVMRQHITRCSISFSLMLHKADSHKTLLLLWNPPLSLEALIPFFTEGADSILTRESKTCPSLSLSCGLLLNLFTWEVT